MILFLLAWTGWITLNNIPEDRNLLEEKQKTGFRCCDVYDSKVCKESVENAYKWFGCINEKEYKIAKDSNLMIACSGTQFGGSCHCGCLDPSSLIRIWDKEQETWKDLSLEILDKNPSRYQVLSGAYENGKLTVAKSEFEVLTCASKPLLEIHFSNQTQVLTSYEHPFKTVLGQNLRADSLRIGDEIPTEEETMLVNKIIKKEPNPKGVMNILIKGKDNQRFILANGVWRGDAKMQEDFKPYERD